ncbi:MAG: SGNH/GDSL hydrolase family protein [Clostridia bacterium]|nr:SGNH/GDSL hydrolase family protein [Clostridia bacterium]
MLFTEKLRCGLPYTKAALARGKLTVGYLGGSITDGRAGHNWSDYFTNWLCAEHPDMRIVVENAAMGSTGSDLGVLRVEEQIIRRGCDLVFIEYAVNDRAKEAEYRFEIREGLIRKLLTYGKCDVIVVYTYDKTMREHLLAGEMPQSVRDFEALAEHYGLSSVWPGLSAFEGWQRGLYGYYEWIPDGLHPQCFGSNLYAGSVKKFFEKALACDKARSAKLPQPMYEQNWENVYLLTEKDISVQGSGYFYRPYHTVPVDLMFHTNALSTKLSFDFEGTGFAVVHLVGKSSYALSIQVDGGEKQIYQDKKADWMGDMGHFAIKVPARHLECGKHHVEIAPVLSDQSSGLGNALEIAFVAVVP